MKQVWDPQRLPEERVGKWKLTLRHCKRKLIWFEFDRVLPCECESDVAACIVQIQWRPGTPLPSDAQLRCGCYLGQVCSLHWWPWKATVGIRQPPYQGSQRKDTARQWHWALFQHNEEGWCADALKSKVTRLGLWSRGHSVHFQMIARFTFYLS